MPVLTILYDGHCGLCRRAVARLRSMDRWSRLELLPAQEPGLERRFPTIDPQRALASMLAVDASGRVAEGFDAYIEIARLLPVWRRLAWIGRLPGVHALGGAVYAWVAHNRYRWNKKEDCGDGSCAIHRGPR